MSVMSIQPEIFGAVFSKFESYNFNRTCDINYCSSASQLFKRGEEYVQNIIREWANLNQTSYLMKYRQNGEGLTAGELIQFKTSKRLNTYECLKHLECIRYNIEKCTIEELRGLTDSEGEALEILSAVIEEIKSVIIHELPEYKAAKWNEL